MDTKALRQKILDLAIRGKLVPQDPNDEPASVLLERIRAQKQQMVKNGKLKAKDIKNDTVIFVGEDNFHYEKFADGTVKCIEDEIPFEIPEGWEWCRLSSIIELVSGQDLLPDKYNNIRNGLPYITGASNISNGKIICNRWTAFPTTHSHKNDLLLTVKGSGVGKMAISHIEDAHIARQIMALRCYSGVEPEYLEIIISAMVSKITSHANGLIPGISRETILTTLIPLSPHNEQTKIARQNVSLRNLVDKIENDRCVLSEIVEIAKAKILDLAIRGKLVPQNPNDEPASVLLERIRAEKEEMIKQGKIKRDKKESVIFKGLDNFYYEQIGEQVTCIDDEIPFEIPEGWCWCRLGSLFCHNTGKALNAAVTLGKMLTYITTSNVYWDSFELAHLKSMPFSDDEIERCTVEKGDLLVCEGGEIGRAAVWNYDEPIRIQNHLHRLRAYGSLNPYFYLNVFCLYKSIGKIKGNGIGLQTLSSSQLHGILVPLLSIDEQERIVEKIHEIFSYIDSIEASLN